MQLMSLDEIAEKENLIIVDNSCIAANEFASHIYSCNYYGQLDLNHLLDTKEKLDSVCNSLSKNIRAIPEMLSELEQFQSILNDKARRFNTGNGLPNRFLGNKYAECKGIERKEIFSDICYLTNEIIRKIKRNQYRPDNCANYEALTDTIKTITSKTRLKEKRGWPKELKEFRRTYKDFNTDEKIISSLFNASLEGNSAAAVSRDSHLMNIFAVSHRLLASEDLLPYNKSFIEKLNKNPARLYLPLKNDFSSYDEKYHVILESDKHTTQKKFMIYKISEEENKKIKEQVKEMFSKMTA